jgi:hypothetical protein
MWEGLDSYRFRLRGHLSHSQHMETQISFEPQNTEQGNLLQNYSHSWFDTSPRTEIQHVAAAKVVRPEVSKGERDFCKRLKEYRISKCYRHFCGSKFLARYSKFQIPLTSFSTGATKSEKRDEEEPRASPHLLITHSKGRMPLGRDSTQAYRLFFSSGAYPGSHRR